MDLSGRWGFVPNALTPHKMKNSLAHSLRCIFALLVIGFAVSSASAGDKAPSEKVLKKYDLDKDGKLDETEMAKWNADKKAAAEKKKAAEAAK
jgi:hypothetical protein